MFHDTEGRSWTIAKFLGPGKTLLELKYRCRGLDVRNKKEGTIILFGTYEFWPLLGGSLLGFFFLSNILSGRLRHYKKQSTVE